MSYKNRAAVFASWMDIGSPCHVLIIPKQARRMQLVSIWFILDMRFWVCLRVCGSCWFSGVYAMGTHSRVAWLALGGDLWGRIMSSAHGAYLPLRSSFWYTYLWNIMFFRLFHPSFLLSLTQRSHILVRRNQKTHTISHTTLNHKMSHCCTALPLAASPFLSMATSTMDLKHAAVAPYESTAGAQPNSCTLRLTALLEMAPVKKLRCGRSTGLGWLPFDEGTQQPTKQ